MAEASFDKSLEVTISLHFPVDVDGEKYTSLTMRRPKTKDTLAAGKFVGSDAERGVLLYARLCNVAPNVIEELDEVDMQEVIAHHAAFTGRRSA